MLNLCRWIICCWCCWATFASAGDAIGNKTKELTALQTQIKQLETTLSRSQDQRETLQSALKKTEKDISQLILRTTTTEEKLKHQRRVLARLEQQTERQQAHVAKQQELLAQQLRAAYQLGHHQYIKLLLNQQNPTTMTRYLDYYQYISQARNELIKQVQHDLTQLAASKKAIKAHAKKLQSLLKHQQYQQTELKQQQHYRHTVLNKLNKTIEDKELRLLSMRKNKLALTNLVAQLKEQARLDTQTQPFVKLKHHLLWPTNGRIINHYGESIGESELIHNGITIVSNEGQAVRAIHQGTVVFADWLRGFGLLIIVDHGQGFLSLYAHNESLMKQTGTKVKAGERIAKVGHSGGFKENGLYFELRQNGKPLNPMSWFQHARS